MENRVARVQVLKRPGVDQFLKEMSTLYELVIFTASVSEYANRLLDKLDPQHLIAHRLYRNHCTYTDKGFVKDLSLIGRDPKTTIIIDNAPISYSLQPFNALPILSWIDDRSDSHLLYLIPILRLLNRVGDVRDYLKKIVKNYRIDYQSILPAFRTNKEEQLKSTQKTIPRTPIAQKEVCKTRRPLAGSVKSISRPKDYSPLKTKCDNDTQPSKKLERTSILESRSLTIDQKHSENIAPCTPERNTTKFRKMTEEKVLETPKYLSNYANELWTRMKVDCSCKFEDRNTLSEENVKLHKKQFNYNEPMTLLEEFNTSYESKRVADKYKSIYRTIDFNIQSIEKVQEPIKTTTNNAHYRTTLENNWRERLASEVPAYRQYIDEYTAVPSTTTHFKSGDWSTRFTSYLKERVPYRYQIKQTENVEAQVTNSRRTGYFTCNGRELWVSETNC
jgi:RNA polymerase II subunit A small phosphatase-like protein